MNAIKFIAACAILTGANATFGHEPRQGQPMHAATAEQKDWGIAGDAKQVRRTITLTMSDTMRFTPGRFEVRQGDTVRLRVRNAGKMQHELVLGTADELAAHAALMRKHPGMEHDEPYMVHVAPGKTGEILWTFNRAGEFEFACLIDGHYQAGMKGSIRVIAAKAGKDTPAAAPAAATHQHGMHQTMQASQPHGNMSGGMHGPSSAGQPYAGEQQREIKALSGQDIQAYENGQGHGFAKAAELNGYPGPMHTLELAKELKLSEAQRAQSQALLTQHKAEARRLGAELIAAERALDQAFASRSINAESLNQLTRTAGEKLAQLRAEHLQTHLAQTALLTPEQIERYQTLRGYGSTMPMQHDMKQHPMMEMNHGQHH